MLTWHDLEIWTFDQALFWRLYSTVFCWLHAGQQVAGLQISSPYRAQMPPKEPPKYLPRMAQVPWELRERLQWSSLADRTKGYKRCEYMRANFVSCFELLWMSSKSLVLHRIAQRLSEGSESPKRCCAQRHHPAQILVYTWNSVLYWRKPLTTTGVDR